MPRVVRIPGLKEPLTFPTGTPTEDIYAAIADRLFPVEEAPPIPKEAPSFFQAFGEGATTLGNVPETLRYLYEPSGATRKEAAATTESPYEYQQISEIGGVGDVGRFIKEQAGQAAGFIAAPVAAAKAASAATPASLPFVGRAAKPIAAATAFLGTAGAQYLSNTAGRQAAEQEKRVKEGQAPEMPEVTKMLLTSAGQAGLDYAGFRLFKPLGELIGLSGKEMIKQRADDILETAIEEGAEAAAKKLIGKQSVLKGAAYGAAVEAAQEPIQQLLERYGAGLALDSDEAIKEYFESAIAGGLLGGPIGGVSTVMSNYQNDAYSKDTLKNLADAIRGGKDPKTEWNKDARKAVLAEAKPISLLDEKGDVISITPEFLSTLGVNPSAKSIMGTPIEDIVGQSATDPGVMTTLQKFFNAKLKETNEGIQRKDITDEERADLVTLHSQLATGLKTFTQQRMKAAVEKGKATKAAKAAATAGITPEAKPTPDDALAVLESDIQKSFGDDAGRVFDLADELMSKGVVTDRAAALAQATKEVAQQKAADVQAAAEAEAETAVVPEPTETVKESADKIAEQEAAKNVVDLTERLEQKEEADLEAGILADETQRGRATLTPKINNEIQEALNLARQAVYENSTIEKRGPTFFPEDTTTAQEFIAGVHDVYKRLEEGTLPNAVRSIENLRNEANNLKQTFQQRITDREKLEKGAKPELKLVPPTPIPEPTPEVAEQMTYLREELGMDGLASAISSRPAQEQVALSKQVTETLDQISQLEKNRTALRAQNDQASIKAVTEQIRKLENSLDDLEYSLTETPNTREQVQEAIKANGNATEANKISTDIRKDMCD